MPSWMFIKLVLNLLKEWNNRFINFSKNVMILKISYNSNYNLIIRTLYLLQILRNIYNKKMLKVVRILLHLKVLLKAYQFKDNRMSNMSIQFNMIIII